MNNKRYELIAELKAQVVAQQARIKQYRVELAEAESELAPIKLKQSGVTT